MRHVVLSSRKYSWEGSMIEIVDKLTEVSNYDKTKTYRAPESVDLLVVHRIGPKLGEVNVHGAEDVAAAFSQHPEWKTGGQMPYNFIIREDGTCEQALALSDAGMHSLKFNARSIGVALVGDFRTSPPTADQMDALTSLCMLWVQHLWARGVYRKVSEVVVGHDALPGASSDPSKACPGRKLDMKQLVAEVERRLKEDLFAAGVAK